jgi:hypothetical protein
MTLCALAGVVRGLERPPLGRRARARDRAARLKTDRGDDQVTSSSFGRRTRLQAAAVSVSSQPTRAVPRCRVSRKPPVVLIQPKPFLDLLPEPLPRRVAGVARRPAVDRRTAAGVLGDVRRDVQGTDGGAELLGVVALVGRRASPGGAPPAGRAWRGAPRVRRCRRPASAWRPISPLRFSMSRCPMWQSFASLPRP